MKRKVSFFLIFYLTVFQFISVPQKTYSAFPLILTPVGVTWLAGLKQVLAGAALVGVTGWSAQRIISDGLERRAQVTYNSLTPEQRTSFHSAIATSVNGSSISLTVAQLMLMGGSQILWNMNNPQITVTDLVIPTVSTEITAQRIETSWNTFSSSAIGIVPVEFFQRTSSLATVLQDISARNPNLNITVSWQTGGIGDFGVVNSLPGIHLRLLDSTAFISRHLATIVHINVHNILTNQSITHSILNMLNLSTTVNTNSLTSIPFLHAFPSISHAGSYFANDLRLPIDAITTITNSLNTSVTSSFTITDISNLMLLLGTANTLIPASISISPRIISRNSLVLPNSIVIPRNSQVTTGSFTSLSLVPSAVTTANPELATSLTTGLATPALTQTVVSTAPAVIPVAGATDITGVMGFLSSIYTGVLAIPTSIARFFDLTIPINLGPLQVAGQTFTTRFPFSIPWDIARAFAISNTAGNQSPMFDININTGLLGRIQFSIDFTAFQHLIAIQRDFLILLFIIGLAILTPKITKV